MQFLYFHSSQSIRITIVFIPFCGSLFTRAITCLHVSLGPPSRPQRFVSRSARVELLCLGLRWSHSKALKQRANDSKQLANCSSAIKSRVPDLNHMDLVAGPSKNPQPPSSLKVGGGLLAAGKSSKAASKREGIAGGKHGAAAASSSGQEGPRSAGGKSCKKGQLTN